MYQQTPGDFSVLHSPEQPTQRDPGYIYVPSEHQRMFSPHLSAIAPKTPESGTNPYEQLEGLHGYVPYESTNVPVAESEMPAPYPQHTNYAYASNMSYTGGTPGNISFPKANFGYTGNHSLDSYIPDKLVNLTISNSRAIQIGNSNYMSVEEPLAINRHGTEHFYLQTISTCV
ncbi:unnamed protein product [Staurois parvus]|uniref:Uncharacterized protein n=1 Tax=Staurois parvus TaxID=386267 RepID=A0ABN9FC53_9NEOB|nr:unnamed protein product [Staurois parvus]